MNELIQWNHYSSEVTWQQYTRYIGIYDNDEFTENSSETDMDEWFNESSQTTQQYSEYDTDHFTKPKKSNAK